MQAVVDCGALDSLVTCLEEFDPGVKEAASWTLGYVAGHSPELAQQVPILPSLMALLTVITAAACQTIVKLLLCRRSIALLGRSCTSNEARIHCLACTCMYIKSMFLHACSYDSGAMNQVVS